MYLPQFHGPITLIMKIQRIKICQLMIQNEGLPPYVSNLIGG